MKTKRTRINKRDRYRALISDVLPYELPVIFSNKGLCSFLQRYRINMRQDGKLYSSIRDTPCWVNSIIEIINGDNNTKKESCSYEILKEYGKEINYRLLTVPHPSYQIAVAELYNKYSDFILYLTRRSRFSIRFPYKLASFQSAPSHIIPKSIYTEEKIDDEIQPKHFFAYRLYQNINGFYDSHDFQRAERKFDFMVRTDIKHCFDHIKPDILYSAIYSTPPPEMDSGFAFEFCQLQKKIFAGTLNNDSDSGIAIGPEFSRVYAEIILQSIDTELKKCLEEKGYKTGTDYAFYRYVDDGFFFCNDFNLVENFPDLYNSVLDKWGLEINESKIKTFYSRPFIDNLTIAKRKLSYMVKDMFFNKSDNDTFMMKSEQYIYMPTQISAKNCIRDMQIIVKEHDCKYEEITPYILLLIRKNLKMTIYTFTSIYSDYLKAFDTDDIDSEGEKILKDYESAFVGFLCELVSFIFHVFSCDTRIATSVKTLQLILEILAFIQGETSGYQQNKIKLFNNKVLEKKIYKRISDELKTILFSHRKNVLEIVNLLLIYHRLPENYCLTGRRMSALFFDKTSHLNTKLDFWSVFTIEHVIGRKYGNDSDLQKAVEEWINKRTLYLNRQLNKNSSEEVYFLLITLSCPYFDNRFKKDICSRYNFIPDPDLLISNSSKYSDLLVNWNDKQLISMAGQKMSAQTY